MCCQGVRSQRATRRSVSDDPAVGRRLDGSLPYSHDRCSITLSQNEKTGQAALHPVEDSLAQRIDGSHHSEHGEGLIFDRTNHLRV
jgi:hypothetical protein